MPQTSFVKSLAPYFVVLAGACYLYYRADNIAYTAIPGRMGPDAWPKISIVCLIAICLIAIIRRAVGALLPKGERSEQARGATVFGSDEDMEALAEESHPILVAGAIIATVGYLLVIETAGFFLSTLVFMAVLMWLGGVRRLHLLVPLAFGAALFFMFIFMRIIFVALPIGIEPFSKVSTAVMAVLGIH